MLITEVLVSPQHVVVFKISIKLINTYVIKEKQKSRFYKLSSWQPQKFHKIRIFPAPYI